MNLSFDRSDQIGWGLVEVRDLALAENDRVKINSQFVTQLKNKIKGKSIYINTDSKLEDWVLDDPSILRL